MATHFMIRTSVDIAKREIWPQFDHTPPIGALVESKNRVQMEVGSITYNIGLYGGTTATIGLVIPKYLNMGILEWERFVQGKHSNP